jgi:hypothetical protein
VYCAIDFDNQAGFQTAKIGNKTVNAVLATEFCILYPASPQALPEFIFGGRWFMTHFAGEGFEFGPQFRRGIKVAVFIGHRLGFLFAYFILPHPKSPLHARCVTNGFACLTSGLTGRSLWRGDFQPRYAPTND